MQVLSVITVQYFLSLFYDHPVFTGAETQSGLVGFSKIEKLSILKKKNSNPCIGTGTI